MSLLLIKFKAKWLKPDEGGRKLLPQVSYRCHIQIGNNNKLWAIQITNIDAVDFDIPSLVEGGFMFEKPPSELLRNNSNIKIFEGPSKIVGYGTIIDNNCCCDNKT